MMRIQGWLRQGGPNRYYAHCPSLPGCAVSAVTVEEAEEALLRSVREYLASYHVAPDRGLTVEFHWAGGKPRRSMPVRPERFEHNPAVSA